MKLFDTGTKPRKPRRVLAHLIDAGPGECMIDGEHIARFGCRCGWESDWMTVRNVTEGKRGIACPECNESEGGNDI